MLSGHKLLKTHLMGPNFIVTGTVELELKLLELCHEKTFCNQVRLKLASSATEISYSLEILALASIGIILSNRQQTIKVLIKLRGCAG